MKLPGSPWFTVLFLGLLLSVTHAAQSAPKRPQEPRKPYPYQEEEVVLQNAKAGVSLAGTLSLPRGDGPFPAVLLISGSGPQNRDEEILGHRPFLVLSDYLVRQGIAVLRLDDRGVGKSTGNPDTALNADLAEDAFLAVQYLRSRKEVGAHPVGLIGHSLGGVIAPLVAQKTGIGFVVLLASPGLKGVDFASQRDRFFLDFAGVKLAPARLEASARHWREINDILMSPLPASEVNERVRPLLEQELAELTEPEKQLLQGLGMELKAGVILREINTPWNRDNLKHDPQPPLRQLKCPVLALYGDKDIFVPAAANRQATEKALQSGGNRKVTVRTLRDTNHFFQTCKTGMPVEAYGLEETVAPAVLKSIVDWIAAQVDIKGKGESRD